MVVVVFVADSAPIGICTEPGGASQLVLFENTSMTLEQKHTCIMCRAKQVADGSKESTERIRGWVKKGKAWAMCMLAQMYRVGLGVKQSDKNLYNLSYQYYHSLNIQIYHNTVLD